MAKNDIKESLLAVIKSCERKIESRTNDREYTETHVLPVKVKLRVIYISCGVCCSCSFLVPTVIEAG